LSWPFSEDPNCDPYGSTSFRTADGTPALPTINDFWYNVWGTKTAVAAPAATPDTTPAVTSDSASQPSGAAPAAPTASIKAPTELSVDDIPTDQGGAIKLDWKASTTSDIDGYKIFRSAEEKKGFAELAKTTDKAILTYIDSTAAIGQKYYYIVRAYKDDKESANSNTINATSIDNMPPAAPKNFTYSKSALGFAFAWDKNAETDLAGYSLQISDSSGKLLKTIEIEKDANLYELIVGDHAELKVETAYQFVLIAQDSSSNFSERTAGTEKSKKEVVAVSSNDSEGKSPLIWYLSSAVAILLIVGGGLYWFKFRKKKLDLTP
jgi:hypothetical protein